MKQVEVTAGTLEYDEQGTGPAVVLLHGLLMNETQWDRVLPLLPTGFRYLRPRLPLGGHRLAMDPGADLSLRGEVQVVADFLEALDLTDVTLVHTDWGGALFLIAWGLDARVGSLVILPCEAWDNFPPGLPGRMASLAARMPGGLRMAARQLRIGWLRRLPILFGQMAAKPLSDELVAHWTEGVLGDDGVLRDLKKYGTHRFDKAALRADTDALAGFTGPALVLWSPDNRVMPPEHGRRLAATLPRATYVEVPGAYVLSMLDEPEAVATVMTDFLLATHPSSDSREPGALL